MHIRIRLLTCRALVAVSIPVAAVMLVPRVAARAADARVIEVTARRFAFEPSEIEATVGERLRLVVRSADGVHGIEIRRFTVKHEIPRGGDPVVVEFVAAEEGRFPILCSEYCGNGHGDMTGTLVVRAASDDGTVRRGRLQAARSHGAP